MVSGCKPSASDVCVIRRVVFFISLFYLSLEFVYSGVWPVELWSPTCNRRVCGHSCLGTSQVMICCKEYLRVQCDPNVLMDLTA